MEYAWIEINHIWDEIHGGGLITDYQWVGKSKLAKISPPYHELSSSRADLNKNELMIGNLHLRVIDHDGMYWIVTPDNWYAPIYKIVHRLVRTGEMSKIFIIIVLSIWGLAEYCPAEIPSWDKIKVIKWITEKWKL